MSLGAWDKERKRREEGASHHALREEGPNVKREKKKSTNVGMLRIKTNWVTGRRFFYFSFCTTEKSQNVTNPKFKKLQALLIYGLCFLTIICVSGLSLNSTEKSPSFTSYLNACVLKHFLGVHSGNKKFLNVTLFAKYRNKKIILTFFLELHGIKRKMTFSHMNF